MSSLLTDTVHRDVLGTEIKFLEGEMPDDSNSNCWPGVCSCNEHFSKVSALVRALQSSLQEKKISTGSLLLLTCRDSPFTRTFFTGVVSKRPLLQTAVLVTIGDDRVSFKANISPSYISTSFAGFLRLQHDAGALHVNPDAVLETFEICLHKREVAKKNPVNLPFGLKPDRMKRKNK